MRSIRRGRFIQALRSTFAVDQIFVTSHYTGEGINELHDYLYEAVQWDKLPPGVPLDVLRSLATCVDELKRAQDIYISKFDLHQLLLERTEFSVSTALYGRLLTQLQIIGMLFQFPMKDYILVQPNILERYIVEFFRIPRQHEKGAMKILDANEMLSRSLFQSIGYMQNLSPDQQLGFNGLVLHFMILNNWALLVNGDLVFLIQHSRK